MKDSILAHQALIDVDDSVLIVIDVQQSFVEKNPKEKMQEVVNRISWIIQMAIKLKVPIIATCEDIPELGTSIPQIHDCYPQGVVEHDKRSFNLADDPTILSTIEETQRRTMVIVGLETDVCVMQSALGLLQKGFRVVVLSDATASPGPCHDAGILRMQNANTIISTVKGTFYEWVRTLDFADDNLDQEVWGSKRPDGIYL